MSGPCEPHAQVISPCSDDAAASLLGLGTRGDVAFSEYGNMPLSAGQTDVAIEFLYEKTDWRYVFVYCYVGNYDGVPTDAIQVVSGSQTSKGFALKLSGAPTTDDSILFWEVRIPDNLQECQSVTSGPKYAIVPVEQHGVTPLVNGQDFIIVTFAEPMPDNNWVFEALSFEKAFSEADALGFVPIVTAHTVNGFTLQFQGAPDSSDYTMRWQVRGVITS